MSSPVAVMGWRNPSFAAAEVGSGWRQLFTAAQWWELEHQALIYKYLVAGVPVPTDLLIPIHRSFESLYHRYPALGYCSYYGKKLDPEPGRCRRTDGKKWRCSKNAYLESKYCERHMKRGRNRSRKLVESKINSQPLQESNSSSSSSRSLQNTTLQFPVNDFSKSQSFPSSHSASSQLQLVTKSYETGNKHNRFAKPLDGAKVEMDELNFFAESPHSTQDSLKMNSSLNSTWGLMSSQLFPISKASSEPRPLHHSQPHFHAMQYLNDVTFSSVPKQPEQAHSFLGKQEYQGPHHLFEWSKARDSWLNLEDDQSKRNSSTTQLSIASPAVLDFSNTITCSPSGF